jgi:hypothetical protein
LIVGHLAVAIATKVDDGRVTLSTGDVMQL